jgi:hypothetical protein
VDISIAGDNSGVILDGSNASKQIEEGHPGRVVVTFACDNERDVQSVF